MAKLLEEIHPGEILLEDFMKPIGFSARQIAADIDVSPSGPADAARPEAAAVTDSVTSLRSRGAMPKHDPVGVLANAHWVWHF